MSANNTEFENNSSEELQTNADDGNKDDESTTSTSQQALKQLNQLTASNSGTTTTVNKTIITTTTTTAMPKIEPKLAISGGTKIVYVNICKYLGSFCQNEKKKNDFFFFLIISIFLKLDKKCKWNTIITDWKSIGRYIRSDSDQCKYSNK